MTTRSRKGEQKREQLRKAAYRCFRDSGYHETTVDGICLGAGSSKGSFYWHYGSKQEVFVDILESWTRQIMDELYEQFEEAVQQDDYIEAITGALAREIHRGRVLIPMWLEFTLQARHEPELRAALAKFYRRARVAIAEILRPLLEGKVSEAELRGVAAAIFGAYTGLLMQDLSDPERADAHLMVGNVMSALGWWLRQLEEARGDALGTLRPLSALAVAMPADDDPPPEGERVGLEELEGLLSSTPEVFDRLAQVRALVLEAAPEASERIISGWKVVGYDLEGLFCHLKPRRGELQVTFYRGAELPDPEGVLVGTGKQRRHVSIPAEGAWSSAALVGLLTAARELQRRG